MIVRKRYQIQEAFLLPAKVFSRLLLDLRYLPIEPLTWIQDWIFRFLKDCLKD